MLSTSAVRITFVDLGGSEFRRTCAFELIKFVPLACSKIWNFRKSRELFRTEKWVCRLEKVQRNFALLSTAAWIFDSPIFPGERTRTSCPPELYGISLSSSHSARGATPFGGFRNPGEDNNKLIPPLPHLLQCPQ